VWGKKKLKKIFILVQIIKDLLYQLFGTVGTSLTAGGGAKKIYWIYLS
jgi:hypothetical protein